MTSSHCRRVWAGVLSLACVLITGCSHGRCPLSQIQYGPSYYDNFGPRHTLVTILDTNYPPAVPSQAR